MRQVFISYSTKDQLQAEAVRNVIEQNGITCWMAPRDIPGGSNYTKEIPHAIRGCQAFVLMLSQNAQNSPWVLKELDSAVNEGKIILPFQLEDITLSDEFNFLLTGAQRYDAYQKKAEALQLLISRIRAIVDHAPAAKAEDAPVEAPAPVVFPQAEPAPKAAFPFVMKQEAKGPDISAFNGVVCPACGAVDVTRLKGKIKARGPQELLVSAGAAAVLGFVLPILFSVILYIIGDIFWIWSLTDDLTVFAIPLGIILGIWIGLRLSKEWIRRRRIRQHKSVEEFRCNVCRKQFLPEK